MANQTDVIAEVTATASTASTTHTYTVPDSLQVPNAVQKEIKDHCKVPLSLPTVFDLDSPLPNNQQLAIDLDVSMNQYGMDFIDRPKGSNTSQYAMANLVGDMETVSDLSSLYIPNCFNMSGFSAHKSVTLSDKTIATYYEDSKTHEDAIIWKNHRWRYIVDVMGGDYEKETVGMANTVASFVSKHGTIVPNATQGYVQALWAGNSPVFRVTWTYNDKQWYSLSMNTLIATLNTAHTVTRVS
ncbi:hypothetical protein GCM10025857_20730 [Alicyclobacillus contaminans]|nr:hypothetical protein GCM10025857_20730 [Alicyclobacillus contaminans]